MKFAAVHDSCDNWHADTHKYVIDQPANYVLTLSGREVETDAPRFCRKAVIQLRAGDHTFPVTPLCAGDNRIVFSGTTTMPLQANDEVWVTVRYDKRFSIWHEWTSPGQRGLPLEVGGAPDWLGRVN